MMLKSLAKQNGTYYRETDVDVTAANGIVFVDTPSGNVLTNTRPQRPHHVNVRALELGLERLARGRRHHRCQRQHHDERTDLRAERCVAARAAAAAYGRGDLDESGRCGSTNVDTDDIGNAPITYNCPSVRNGGRTSRRAVREIRNVQRGLGS